MKLLISVDYINNKQNLNVNLEEKKILSFMLHLYILNETFTNGLDYNFLNIISLVCILSGVFVIISKNPIVSVLFLIGLFLGISIYLMMLGINFIGLSYLLVYVGAVSILFLFILMLINVRISELLTDNNNSFPSVILISVIFTVILYNLLPSNSNSNISLSAYTGMVRELDSVVNIIYSSNDNLSYVSSHIWDGNLAEASHITSIGAIIYTAYPIWLILTSIILLLAMVGAIVITIKTSSVSFASPKPNAFSD